MPHIIVEYAKQLENDTQVDVILTTIHCSIAESGCFKADQIKSRAYPFEKFTNAGGQHAVGGQVLLFAFLRNQQQ